jgi:hypothetical protein
MVPVRHTVELEHGDAAIPRLVRCMPEVFQRPVRPRIAG